MEVPADRTRERASQESLRATRGSLEQHVTAREDRDEHRLDGPVVPDDGSADLRLRGVQKAIELTPGGGIPADVDDRRHPRTAGDSSLKCLTIALQPDGRCAIPLWPRGRS